MRALLFLATLLALPAAASEPPARMTVTVDLTYRERIALPPGGTAEAVLSIGGTPVARSSAALTGQQVPLRLLLVVPRSALTGGEAEIAGRIAPPAGAAWTGSRRVTLDPAAPRAELGPLLLTRGAPARETRFDCGEERVVFAVAPGGTVLRLGGDSIPLREAPAASGARYQGAWRDAPIEFWERGESARLAIGDRVLPECILTPPDLFRASGNEPAWLLTIMGDRAVLALGFERREVAVTLGPPADGPGGVLRASAPGQPPVRVTIAPGPCQDSMSGVGFANRVTVEAEGRTFSGCGGTLASRLVGAPWTVTEIAGQPAAGLRPVTLRFEEGGRSGGQGPCNTYGGD
jgi:uncharacterized membrane protein/membrane-bound inhibitor of C-type lysozyme